MKIRKELWFGFSLMAVIVTTVLIFTPWTHFADGHLSREDLANLGLLMLGLIVVAIMLGFPTAFTLMGMGVFFAWVAYRSVNPELATRQVLDLMVQRAYSVMSNDVLIAVPLFVFMGYLVERAALIDRLFKSLHLALARLPGSLAVATIVTCAIFATATGIVGAVVTLMGLLAFPAMLRAGYDVKISAGSITAGGCLGILIPPSVLLIVYGATAGVSVVQLYAGAFFPGFMLAAMYVGYVMLLAKLKPKLMPPLSAAERRVSDLDVYVPDPERVLTRGAQDVLPGVAIGAELAAKLDVREGDPITLAVADASGGVGRFVPRTGQFRVARIFRTNFSEYDTEWVFLDREELRRLARMEGRANVVEVRLESLAQTETASAARALPAGPVPRSAPAPGAGRHAGPRRPRCRPRAGPASRRCRAWPGSRPEWWRGS